MSETCCVTAYSALLNTKPAAQSMQLTWTDFCQLFGGWRSTKSKTASPLWSPTIVEGTRANANVRACGPLVLDLDDGSAMAVLEKVQADGLEFIFHTTHSTTDEHIKGRVIIPLSEECSPEAFRSVWQYAARRFSGADVACKDVSRAYYLPPEGCVYTHVKGKALDVDSIPAQTSVPTVPLAPLDVTPEDLVRLAKALGKRTSHNSQVASRSLLKVAAGEAYAVDGERNNLTYALVGFVVRRWPTCSPMSVAAVFGPSLSHMGDDCPDVEGMAARLQQAIAEEAKPTYSGFFDSERTNPLTERELDDMAAGLEMDRAMLERTWALRYRGGEIYIRNGQGRYNSLDPRAFSPQRDLAAVPGLRTTRQTDAGEIGLSPGEFLDTCYRITEVRYDYEIPACRVQNGMLLQPVPRKVLSPEYHAPFQEWFETLDIRVQDWIVRAIKEPGPCLPALVFHGERVAGKSLFAEALARVWEANRYSEWAEAISENDAGNLAHTPVVFADESFEADAEQIRKLVFRATTTIRAKYRAATSVSGNLRILVALNNLAKFKLGGSLNWEEVQATAERLIFIQVGPDTRAVIEKHFPHWNTWKEDHTLTQHLLWIAENHTPETHHTRSGFRQDLGAVALLASKTGLRSKICQWCAEYILSGAVDSTGGKDSIELTGEGLLISPRILERSWGVHGTGRAPGLDAVASALEGISEKRDHRHLISREVLLGWAADKSYPSLFD